MCGIVGAIAERNVTPILMEGLRRLEYRGYDSGRCCCGRHGERQLKRVRALGKVKALTDMLKETPVSRCIGNCTYTLGDSWRT